MITSLIIYVFKFAYFQKDYRAYVIFIDGERENAIDFVRLVMEVVATGVRSKFRVIQKASILSWVRF